MDLCFVPVRHTDEKKLPAVSGSSGHLVVAHLRTDEEPSPWPGQVFAETDLDYEAAMRQYAANTQDRLRWRKAERPATPQELTRWRKEWEGRAERYRVRDQRKRQQAAWKAAKLEWRQTRCTYLALPRLEREKQRDAYLAAQQSWEQIRQQRQETLRQWKQEDQEWHQANRHLKTGATTDTSAPIWIAILVVTDNCTRQCLGLPIFRTGPKVTADEVITALQVILPKDLAFMISDQGTHFRSKALANLAEEAEFIHVPSYRHRPQSNGIAERFVLTLKNWLRHHSWEQADALEGLLAKFRPEYNDRPHQGLAIPGLSPNEFANRIWLM